MKETDIVKTGSFIWTLTPSIGTEGKVSLLRDRVLLPQWTGPSRLTRPRETWGVRRRETQTISKKQKCSLSIHQKTKLNTQKNLPIWSNFTITTDYYICFRCVMLAYRVKSASWRVDGVKLVVGGWHTRTCTTERRDSEVRRSHSPPLQMEWLNILFISNTTIQLLINT